MKFIKDVAHLFLPNRCLHCKAVISNKASFLCLDCDMSLELTHFTQVDNNPVKSLFFGSVNVVNATSVYFYQKNAPIQTMLKELKYRGLTSFGLYAAKILITDLKTSPYFKSIDCVVPVPLHPKKEKQRGYNQIELFGTTLAGYLGVEFKKEVIVRKENNQSQTKQNKDQRYNSVKNSFEAKKQNKLNNKHILLVDDVLTTGATLISCCKAIQKEYNVRISIITIACVI